MTTTDTTASGQAERDGLIQPDNMSSPHGPDQVLPALCFVGTETTSLLPDRRAWDTAIIRREPDGRQHEHQWFTNIDDLRLDRADITSLKIGGFFDRHPTYTGPGHHSFATAEPHIAYDVEHLTRGALIVGAVPWFDTQTLDPMLRRHRLLPTWHYHLIDVETLAAGVLGLQPPWDFAMVLAAYGLTYPDGEQHTALGDARMAMALYDKVYGITTPPTRLQTDPWEEPPF